MAENPSRWEKNRDTFIQCLFVRYLKAHIQRSFVSGVTLLHLSNCSKPASLSFVVLGVKIIITWMTGFACCDWSISGQQVAVRTSSS